MRILKAALLMVVALVCHSALAETPGLDNPGPLGELQAQIDALNDRIASLEANAPTPDVEGRTYCMMANVEVQRGWSNTATEETQEFIVRRLTTFSGGAFTATTIDGKDIKQDDNGVVSGGTGGVGDVLAGVYTQTGTRLDIVLDNGQTRVWYVSADGSVIYNNSSDHFGPFPSSLSVGVLRNATLIESDTCDV